MKKKRDKDSIGNRIRIARVLANLTQAELASLVGMSTPTICHYERGKCGVKVDMLEKIAKALGVPVSLFFGNQPL
jgi:Predicted transcriptional regulators